MKIERYAVFFAIITEEEGLFVDYTYLGGKVNSKTDAAKLAQDLTNNMPSAIITKIFPFQDNTFREVVNMANKHFNRMALDMYDEYERRSKK